MPVLWILVPLLVLAAGIFYVGKRLITPFGLPPRRRKIVWIAIGVWGLLLYLSLFMSRIGGEWSWAVSWIGYVSLGLLSFLFCLVLVRDIILLLVRGGVKLGSLFRSQPQGETSSEPDRARREYLLQVSSIGVLGVAGVLTSYGLYEARRRPGIVEIEVPIRRLPPAFQGFRIVQISDVHAGLTVGRGWIETVVEEVDGLHPDMIAFTGDIADGSVAHLRDAVAPFAELRAPQGKFFITGNHEYYSGAEEWVKEVQRLGYDALINEHRVVQRNGAAITIAGVTDYTGGDFLPSHRSDPRKAFDGASSVMVKILLAHQPKTLRQASGIDFDLMLAGHTHGGQFFPWNLLAAVDQPYIHGLHRPNGRWVYVNKGTGYWGPPVRLGARSEITVVKLVAEAA
jgi:uncharacterized protein